MIKKNILNQYNNGDTMNLLITGASSGIAKDVIEKIKHKNINIYPTVHTYKELINIGKKYERYPNIHPIKIDVTSDKDKQKLGNLDIDILLCNAAVGYGGSISEIPISLLKENFEVNVFSNFEIVQIVLKKMISKKEGKIIMMSSLAGIYPIPFLGSYSATKASIIQLSKALRKELKLLDVHIPVVLIEPGFYKTGFNLVMFENKYDSFDHSYFKDKEENIRKKEEFILQFLGKKNLNSISKCIIDAILKQNPKKIYRAPFLQKVGIFLYKIIS